MQIELLGTRTYLSLQKGDQYSKSHKHCNESLRINVNEELSEFKDPVIEKFDGLKSSFLAKVDSFKERNCDNDASIESSKHLLK